MHCLARTLDLRDADMSRVMHDLPLQVVQRNMIVVDDAECANARRRQI